jgi:hypothetical protein
MSISFPSMVYRVPVSYLCQERTRVFCQRVECDAIKRSDKELDSVRDIIYVDFVSILTFVYVDFVSSVTFATGLNHEDT